ncbi:hypothetical protein [Rhodocaloribacter sp.]
MKPFFAPLLRRFGGIAAALALAVMGLAGCRATNAVGPGTSSSGDAASGGTFVALLGYSNTLGTAEAVARLGYEGFFAPAEDIRRGQKLLLDRPGDLRENLVRALRGQVEYAGRTGRIIGAVWWQIGIRRQQNPMPSEAHRRAAHRLVTLLEEMLPGVDVYVSSMTPYEGHVCAGAGPAGPAASAVLADALAETYAHVHRVPAFPPLSREETRDGCHPTDEVYLRNARALVASFEALRARDGERSEK